MIKTILHAEKVLEKISKVYAIYESEKKTEYMTVEDKNISVTLIWEHVLLNIIYVSNI